MISLRNMRASFEFRRDTREREKHMTDFKGKKINANYKYGSKTLIGKLYFCEEGFEYKANSVDGKFNMGKIQYKDIQSVEIKRTLGLIPNSLIIETKDSEKFHYIVGRTKDICDFLKNQMNGGR